MKALRSTATAVLLFAALAASCVFDVNRDDVPPTVTVRNPEPGAVAVPINTTVMAIFSEEVDTATIGGSFSLSIDGANVEGTLDPGSLVTVFDSAEDLLPNTSYTVTIGTGLADLEGNTLEAADVWTFTTGNMRELDPPGVVTSSLLPAPGAVRVPLDVGVTIVFDEIMNGLTLTVNTIYLTAGSDPTSLPASIAVGPDGRSAILTPASDLAPETTYTVMVTTGVADASDNVLAEAYSWSFTTNLPPTARAAALRFQDTDPLENRVAGTLVVERAPDESDIDEYVVYWGDVAGRRLSPIATLPRNGSDPAYSLPSTEPPSAAVSLLVFTRNVGRGAEAVLGRSCDLVDAVCRIAADVYPYSIASNPGAFASAGGHLVFDAVAYDTYSHAVGREMLKYNGLERPVLLRDLDYDTTDSIMLQSPAYRRMFQNCVYFYASGYENLVAPLTTGLWRTDGDTTAQFIHTADSTSVPVVCGDYLYFGDAGNLYQYDGLGSFVSVSNTNAVTGFTEMAELGGVVYMQGTTAGTGAELYFYDPVSANPIALVSGGDINGAGDSSPASLTACGGKLYFSAAPSGAARRLYVYTPGGSVAQVHSEYMFNLPVGPLFASGGRLYFFSGSGAFYTSVTLFAYNPGADSVETIESFHYVDSSRISAFADYGGRVMFTALDGSDIMRLWVYDGARAVPVAQQAVVETPALELSPNSQLFVWTDGGGRTRLYFTGRRAGDDTNLELWTYYTVD